MPEKVEQALLLNWVQQVPYYRELSWNQSEPLLFFDPQGINWQEGTISGLMLHRGRWRRGEFPFPSTIYNRHFPEPTRLIRKLSEVIGSEKIFNSRTHFDKWELYEHLKDTPVGEYLPATYLYSGEELPQLLEEYEALILKPRRGHGGAGVFKLTLVGPQMVLVTSQTVSFPLWGEVLYLPLLLAVAPPGRFIAQEYVQVVEEGNAKFDVRILMQKNGAGEWAVGGELSRVTRASSLLTNGYRAVLPAREVVAPAVLNQMYAVSFMAAHALDGKMANLGEFGADFVLDVNSRLWLLEINGKPDKGLFFKLQDEKMLRRIYLNPLNYQNYLLQK